MKKEELEKKVRQILANVKDEDKVRKIVNLIHRQKTEKKHQHYWEIQSSTVYDEYDYEYGYNTAIKNYRQYVLIICHECGEVKKKYL